MNYTNINGINFQEYHLSQNVLVPLKDKLDLSSDSETDKILKFQTELENNEKKLNSNSFQNQHQNSNLFHFSFSDNLIESDKKHVLKNKINSSEYNNILYTYYMILSCLNFHIVNYSQKNFQTMNFQYNEFHL